MSSWLLASRPATLPAAVAPVLVGAAVAGSEDHFRAAAFAATLVAALFIQVGTNMANDVSDFERGADTHERLGPPRATQTGLLTARQVRAGALASFGVAALLGLYLAAVGGWPVIVTGLACIAAGLAYTGGPWPIGYHGLGDLFVFVFFGLVAVVGTYYLQAGGIGTLAVLAALPTGLTVTAILVVNNLRDIDTDRLAGKRTLAVRLGDRGTRLQYAAMVLGAYALIPATLLAGAGLWVLLAFASLPLAFRTVRPVLGGARGRALNPMLKGTARLHLIFGSLLALGLLL